MITQIRLECILAIDARYRELEALLAQRPLDAAELDAATTECRLAIMNMVTRATDGNTSKEMLGLLEELNVFLSIRADALRRNNEVTAAALLANCKAGVYDFWKSVFDRANEMALTPEELVSQIHSAFQELRRSMAGDEQNLLRCGGDALAEYHAHFALVAKDCVCQLMVATASPLLVQCERMSQEGRRLSLAYEKSGQKELRLQKSCAQLRRKVEEDKDKVEEWARTKKTLQQQCAQMEQRLQSAEENALARSAEGRIKRRYAQLETRLKESEAALAQSEEKRMRQKTEHRQKCEQLESRLKESEAALARSEEKRTRQKTDHRQQRAQLETRLKASEETVKLRKKRKVAEETGRAAEKKARTRPSTRLAAQRQRPAVVKDEIIIV